MFPAGLPKVMCTWSEYIFTHIQIGLFLTFRTLDSQWQSHNWGYNYIFSNTLKKMEENVMVCIVLEVGTVNTSGEIQFQELVYIYIK